MKASLTDQLIGMPEDVYNPSEVVWFSNGSHWIEQSLAKFLTLTPPLRTA